MEIPRQNYDKLNKALKEMNMPYHNAQEFISTQISEILDQYEKWPKERRETEE